MRTSTVVIFLCLALVANASWFESLAKSSWFSHLMNHTKLEGKLDLNTTNGVKVDYNAKLGYKNGMLAVGLADVGAKFNVESHNASTNLSDGEFNKTYDYTGAVVVNHNGHKANVGVNGTANVAGAFNFTNDTNGAHGQYKIHTKNSNAWKANAGDLEVDGNHIGLFKSYGNATKNGSHIKIQHAIRGYAAVGANVTNNGTNVGFGFAVKGGDVNVSKHVYLTGGNTSEVNYQGHHVKPDAVTNGHASYEGFTKFGWNNNTQAYTKKGHAGFEGIAWTKSKDNENGTFNGFAAANNIDFSHVGQIWSNGTKVADTLTVGDVALLKSAGIKVNKDGSWKKGFGSTGVLNKWTAGKLAGHHEELNSSESTTENNNVSEEFTIQCILNKFSSNKTMQELCDKQRKIDNDNKHHNGEFLAKFKSNWAHHAFVNGSNADNGTNIDFETGTLYKIGGYDTISKKPWEHHGYKAVSGSYNVSAEDDKLGNLSIHF